MIISSQMLWKEFDRHFMPLDTFLLSSVSGADFCEQSVYFNGGANASCNARIFARLVEPLSQKSEIAPPATANFSVTADISDTIDLSDGYDSLDLSETLDIIGDKAPDSYDPPTINEPIINEPYISEPTINEPAISEETDESAKEIIKKSCLIIMPDFDQDVGKMQINAKANGDVSVLVVDWAGDYNNRSRHTIYPKNMDYANFDPQTYTTYVPQNPQNCCWYEWACALLRAITFMESLGYNSIGAIGVGVGSDSVWKASAYDSSLRASACLLDSGLESFNGASSNEQLNFLASIQSINYASAVNCPMFMLAETNAESGNFNKMIDEYNSINRDDKLLYILQRADSFLNEEVIINLQIWFGFYLLGKGSLPRSANLITKKSENSLYYQISTDSDSPPKSAYIFSTQNSDIIYRFWRQSKLESISGADFIGNVNFFDATKKMLSYANVTFCNGFCCSTPIITIDVTKLNASPLKITPRRLIYDTDMGINEFISVGSQSALKIQKGYNNISGILLNSGCILTYKLGDFLYGAHGATSLQFIICSYTTQNLVFKITDSVNKNSYFFNTAISPKNEWVKITLGVANFKNSTSFLTSFDNIALLEIFASNQILINTILWI